MKIKILLIIAILIIACKNEEKSRTKEASVLNQVQEKEPSKIILEVDLTTSHPDEFRLFANNVFLNNNQSMNISVMQKLISNEMPKKMTFEFPENIQPDFLLGFNLGTKFEKEVQITNMKLKYGVAEFQITAETLNDYFTHNKFVNIDSETNKITTRKIENRHNPMLIVRRKILDSIQNVD